MSSYRKEWCCQYRCIEWKNGIGNFWQVLTNCLLPFSSEECPKTGFTNKTALRVIEASLFGIFI